MNLELIYSIAFVVIIYVIFGNFSKKRKFIIIGIIIFLLFSNNIFYKIIKYSELTFNNFFLNKEYGLKFKYNDDNYNSNSYNVYSGDELVYTGEIVDNKANGKGTIYNYNKLTNSLVDNSNILKKINFSDVCFESDFINGKLSKNTGNLMCKKDPNINLIISWDKNNKITINNDFDRFNNSYIDLELNTPYTTFMELRTILKSLNQNIKILTKFDDILKIKDDGTIIGKKIGKTNIIIIYNNIISNLTINVLSENDYNDKKQLQEMSDEKIADEWTRVSTHYYNYH